MRVGFRKSGGREYIALNKRVNSFGGSSVRGFARGVGRSLVVGPLDAWPCQ